MRKPYFSSFFRSGRRIQILLFLFLWIYLWIRALLIPVAHDEVATFFYYVNRGTFFPFFSHWDTNNHFLNSLLTWVSCKLTGISPLSLRIPNLLFFPVFFFYCVKISSELRHPFLRWTFILSLCFAHSFIEFFDISRGYGISMALFMGAVWYLMRFVMTRRLRFISLCLLFMVLATYANLALINTLFITVTLIFLYALMNDKAFAGKDEKILSLLFFLGVIPIVFFGLILLRLKFMGNLWAGSAKGLWDATVITLTRLITTSFHLLFCYFVLFWFVLACLLFLFLIIRERKQKFFQDPATVFFYLLAGDLIAVTVLGNFFGINWPEDRIALYFFPLFTGSLLFLIDRTKVLEKFYLNILLVLPLFFLPFQFFFRMNVAYNSFYVSDNIPPRFYDEVYKFYKQGTLPPTMGGYKGRHFCWSYLDFRHGGKLSPVFSTSYPGYETDFQIVNVKENPDWLKYYDSLDYDKYSGYCLLKRKTPVTKEFILGSPEFSTGRTIDSALFQVP